jgi:DNA-binding transcriptional LysR family regulator
LDLEYAADAGKIPDGSMNLRNIDVNLLVIFDALMAERSVTRAARKIGMSPSAVSHALRRLRETFNDDLVRRTPQGMVPTLRGLDLAKSLRVALQEIERAVGQQLYFEPRTAERTFQLSISDYLTLCFLPRFCVRVRHEAPNVTLVVGALQSSTDLNLDEPGVIQVRVCFIAARGRDYNQKRIISHPFVVAMRRDHPAAKQEMTLDLFLELPFIKTSEAVVGSRIVDAALEGQGLSRRIAVMVPCLAAVVPILQHSDLCAILPEHWIKLYSAPGSLATAALPLAAVQYTVDIIWHRGDDKDAGHRWLRGLIEEELELVYSIGPLGWSRPAPGVDLHLPARSP